jgi:hypothetical protein
MSDDRIPFILSLLLLSPSCFFVYADETGYKTGPIVFPFLFFGLIAHLLSAVCVSQDKNRGTAESHTKQSPFLQ